MLKDNTAKSHYFKTNTVGLHITKGVILCHHSTKCAVDTFRLKPLAMMKGILRCLDNSYM